MVTLAWHEIISWAVTIISVALLVTEHRKNPSYYMVLQGILRACNQRANFLAATMQSAGDRQIPSDEFKYILGSEYTNYVSLQEHIMGSMKSLQPHKDMPFDVGGFIDGHRPAQGEGPENPKFPNTSKLQ